LPVVALRGVAKTFASGVQALDHLDLDVRRGEFLSLLGPSGCGKSTALRLIAGLSEPSRGRISWGTGEAATGPRGHDIGFVFQEPTLMPWATVAKNVALPLRLRHMPPREIALRVSAALDGVGLAAFRAAYPRELSGGMKMRVSIARALVTDPSVLLMDEPFAALDEQTRMVLGEDLSALLATTGKTIVFVTHSLVEAVFLADRVAVLTARPGTIKQIIHVDEGHPRKSTFMTSAKLGALRNELYDLLHDEIRRTISLQENAGAAG
jgi:NitT/TauT family transport system ATP-binding protein